jgi:hypothetical protein
MTLLRRVDEMSVEMKAIHQSVNDTHELSLRHEEQISGKQGILVAINALTEEMKGVKRALWGAASGVVVAAVVFAFAVMQATGQA